MFKNILVPVDGSESALRAMDRAIGLARAFGSRVSAVVVIDPFPFAGVGAELGLGQDAYREAADHEAREALDAVKALAERSGQQVEVLQVEAPAVYRGILDAARDSGADLIVMGSHGRKGLERLVLGSVTQRVLNDSTIPVLVERPPAPRQTSLNT